MDKMTDKLNCDLNTNSLDTQNIKDYIKQLKNKSCYFFNIPEEYRLHPAIVATERELGIRKSLKKGYDVINNTFFVEELVLHKKWNDEIVGEEITTFFTDFSSYYEFLQSDIYENACYFKYSFSKDEIIKYSIDISKINFKQNLSNFVLNQTISDFFLNINEEEQIISDNLIERLSGSRSAQAASALKSMGYTNVANIGGISAYRGKVVK